MAISSFIDFLYGYEIGKIYFIKGYISTDPWEIVILSKKPSDDDSRYWGYSIGSKYKGEISFNIRPYEKDMYHPTLIRPDASELKKIKEYLNSVNYNKIKYN